MESQQKKDDKCCRKLIRKAPVFLVGIAFAVFCFIAINAAMKPVSTSLYCGTKCHEMETAYKTWQLSKHGANKFGISVDCIKCHLPPKDKYFTHLAAKAYTGAKDMYKHHFGDEYDVAEAGKKVIAGISNQTCKTCHNNLLAKPANSAARKAHTEALNISNKPEIKCLTCHENVAHQRQSKIYLP